MSRYVGGFLSLLLASTTAYLVVGPLPTVDVVPLFFFLCTAAAFELASPRLPGWGFQSCGVGCYLGYAVLVPDAWVVVQILALNLLFLRGAVWGGKKPWQSFLADAVPLSVMLAVLKLVSGGPAGLAISILLYLLLRFLLPGLLEESEPPHRIQSRKTVLVPVAALLFIGAVFDPSLPQSAAYLLIYGIVVFTCREMAIVRAVSKKELALTHLGLIEEKQSALLKELDEVSRKARTDQKGRSTLALVQRMFSDAKTLKAALQGTLEPLASAFEARSYVVFLSSTDGLLPFVFKSPDSKALAGAPLTQLTEPLAQTCWRENRPFYHRRRNWPDRLLPGELSVAVVPLPGYGVLYLGRLKEPFDRATVDILAILGRQIAFSIQILLERLQQAEQFAFVSDERRRLSRWLHRMDMLMEASRSFYHTTRPEEVFRAVESALQELLPHHAFAVIDGGENPVVWSQEEGWDRDEVRKMVQKLSTSLKPLSADSFGLLKGQHTTLGIPLARHRIAFVLVDFQNRKYNAEQLDLFLMVGNLAASALDRIRLQRDFLKASKEAAIGQLAAGLSHELNTPLGVVRLQLDLAASRVESQPKKAVEGLEAAALEVERAQRILSGLLYYSTSYGVERERFELVPLVREVVGKANRSFISLRVPEGRCPINGFRLDVEQMVSQVLDNAVQAAEENPKPAVTVSLVVDSSAVRLEIRDNGPGVAPEIQERVFEPFFTTRPVGKGLGLGLTVASQIAKLHEGSLELETSPSGGTLVRISLPLQWSGTQRETKEESFD